MQHALLLQIFEVWNMSSACGLCHSGRLAMVVTAALLSFGVANAQITTAHDASASPDVSAPAASAADSSSTEYTFLAEPADALPASPKPASSSAGQYDNKSSKSSDWKGKLALEFGGGFDPPTSNSSNYISTGYNVNVGGGLHMGHGVSLLVEYQFIRSGLPKAIVQQAGSDGGNVHLWSLGLEPVIDLMPHHNTGVYVTGGGGFYRKVTNFTVQTLTTYCYYFYCGPGYTTQTAGHFSSNQGGWNIGGGVSHRFAGMYGDGKMAIFAEARYLDVNSPAVINQSANGLGNTTIGAGTKLIPITFGLRF
jgi:hypothetical protein